MKKSNYSSFSSETAKFKADLRKELTSTGAAPFDYEHYLAEKKIEEQVENETRQILASDNRSEIRNIFDPIDSPISDTYYEPEDTYPETEPTMAPEDMYPETEPTMATEADYVPQVKAAPTSSKKDTTVGFVGGGPSGAYAGHGGGSVEAAPPGNWGGSYNYSGASSRASSQEFAPIPKFPRLKEVKEVQYKEPYSRIKSEREPALPDLESSKAKLPIDIELFDVFRNSLKIFRVAERTLVYAVAVDKKGKNAIARIRCEGGVALGGYALDCSADAFLVECAEFIQLGTVPFSYRIEVPGAAKWSMDVPIPQSVLIKTFSPAQRKALNEFREKFSKEQYTINYLQMILAN